MKKKGNVAEYGRQRNEELKRTVRRMALSGECKSSDDIFSRAAGAPATRFWVGERRAYEVISGMMRGKSIDYMKPMTRRMYNEIYARVKRLLSLDSSIGLEEAVFRVVNSPAPEFYLTAGSARVIMSRG